jgi:hypothetical protein
MKKKQEINKISTILKVGDEFIASPASTVGQLGPVNDDETRAIPAVE